MMIVIALFIVVICLSDVFLIRHFLRHKSEWVYFVFFLPECVIAGLLLLILAKGVTQQCILALSMIVLCVIVPKIVFALLTLVESLFFKKNKAGHTFFQVLSMCLCVAIAALVFYGFVFGAKKLVVKEQKLVVDTLPSAFDGYRIVQISDLHVGSYVNDTNFVVSLVDRVNCLNPDLIVFTGDIINQNASELSGFTRILSRLQAHDGVMAVLGNHDYGTYGSRNADSIAANLKRVKEYERSFGWNLLLNEHCFIERNSDSIAVVGVENTGKGRFPKYANLNNAIRDINENIFTILLSHDPSHWRMEVLSQTHIPLMLSGHTHALQFQVGRFSPSVWLYQEWGGLYQEAGQQLYVSTGIGGGVPFRLGAWPQVDLITLTQK